jgi:2-oxoglutarate ferredoxin oxidoreductase subunit beta
MKDDLTTSAEVTWCPGCGNFGIFNAFKKVVRQLEKQGVGREKIFITAGIGQHAKIFDYVNVSGFYGLHGRSMATAQGVKLANPELVVVDFVGDGDAMGEGLGHLLFAAKRNADITVVMHDNGIYALTTGQRSPLSEKGYKGPSTPRGNEEEPFNPLTLLMEAGATFVARSYSGNVNHLAEMIIHGVRHQGFSFIDVLQPCVTFNNKYELYNTKVEVMEEIPNGLDEAVRLARLRDRLPIGIFLQVEKMPHHRALYGDRHPMKDRFSRKQRVKKIEEMLQTM